MEQQVLRAEWQRTVTGARAAEGSKVPPAMAHLALTAVGRDRPGIVAAVSKALLDHSVNIEDSQMTILRGHFAMMLVVSLPEGADAARVRSDLAAAGERLSLEAVAFSPLEEIDAAEEPVPSHIVTVYGVFTVRLCTGMITRSLPFHE